MLASKSTIFAVMLAGGLLSACAQSPQDHGAPQSEHASPAQAQAMPPADAGGQGGMAQQDMMAMMSGGMMSQAGKDGRGMTMPMSGMMGMRPGIEHLEGRLAFLKTELKITDVQAPQWNAFAD